MVYVIIDDPILNPYNTPYGNPYRTPLRGTLKGDPKIISEAPIGSSSSFEAWHSRRRHRKLLFRAWRFRV